MMDKMVTICPRGSAYLAAGLFLAACTPDDAGGAPPASQAKVQALSDEFLDAFNRGDAAALSELFAVDGLRVVSGRQLPSSGRGAIKAQFEGDIAQHNAQLENKLVSEVLAVRDLGDGIVLADGAFKLNDKDGAMLLGGKWGTVYRRSGDDLEIVMESAHVAKDTIKEPLDYSKIERAKAPAPDFGDAAQYADAMNQVIRTYSESIKKGDAAAIAGLFTEDGIQLVSSSLEANRGRAAIQAGEKENLAVGGYEGMDLTAELLGLRKISDSLICANGTFQVAGADGVVMEFGQWGNLVEVQPDGSLLMVMESAGALHVAK